MRTLSSSLTFLEKYLITALWIVAFGIGTIAMFMSRTSELPKLPFLIVWVIGSIFLYLVCGRIKKVRLKNDILYISNYIGSIEVNISEVQSVSGSILLNPELIWFKLRTPTKFGNTIIFMPKSRLFGGFNRHPLVKELRKMVSKHQPQILESPKQEK